MDEHPGRLWRHRASCRQCMLPCARCWPECIHISRPGHVRREGRAPPAPQTRLQGGYFSNRVVEGAKKHVRAFASEVLSALQVLGLFTSLVLAPSGALPDYVVLVQLTCAVIDLLRLGDADCAHTERLALLQEQLHRHFMRVMPQCRKPKLHAMHHIAPRCVG